MNTTIMPGANVAAKANTSRADIQPADTTGGFVKNIPNNGVLNVIGMLSNFAGVLGFSRPLPQLFHSLRELVSLTTPRFWMLSTSYKQL